ncbi:MULTISPECIES: response regulator transcription factor [Bacillaceae]|uniref:Response regulator transcription factor n=1 Tax=Evansella alkalicola TaxID=745819 RepID=A0ABS6JQQ3_9BACI|nr:MULTISPECIES: response regulator transcription factor [Bacillaceae]MBU9720876.1 response regulator transcription factor [Bacillus alkalicola]
MSKEKILIIEDDEKIARVVRLELEYEGYSVEMSHDGLNGLKLAKEKDWDLILLDIMIPELNGMEVLRRIRSSDELTPIILLSARDSIVDKVAGLDLGANDYITKPYQIEELLARIRSCIRIKRSQVPVVTALQVSDLIVDEALRTVMRGTKEIELTKREYDLLVYLLKNKNQVLQREQILESVWGYDYMGETNVVDVYIRYLRKKIDDGFRDPLILTIRGVGYILKEPSQ